MLLSIISVVVMLSISTIGAKTKSKEVERGNAYVDELLQDIVEDKGNEFDPYPMNDTAVGFNKKVMFVNVSGEAKLSNGYVTGLKTLHRAEDCKLTKKDGRLYVTADLGVGVVNLNYDGTVKFMNLGPTITIHGSVNYIEILMEFSVDPKTGKDGKVHKFNIDDLRGMKVWITGLGPIRWALNPILSGVTKIFKRFVKRLIENKTVEHITRKMLDFQFPIEDDDEVTAETDSSIGEDFSQTTTEEPFTEEETGKPVTEEETEEPVTEEETEEPVTEKETEEETEEPVTEEETEEPVTEEETVEPVTEEETEEPVIEEETDEPIIEEETEEEQEFTLEEIVTEEDTELTEEEPEVEIMPEEEDERDVEVEHDNIL